MLRVFLVGPPASDRADPWLRFGGDGRVVARGRDHASRWPADAQTEIVLAARHVRLVALALPPMPRNRLPQAARFAVEDQLASAPDESSVAAQRANGTVLAAIASRALIDAVVDGARVTRVVPESALAPAGDGWAWYASAAGDGFVRRHDGSTFPVGAVERAAPGNSDLPPELVIALAQAQRTDQAPACINVAFPIDDAHLARWSSETGVRFDSAPAWTWEQAGAAAFASAPDFVERDGAVESASQRSSVLQRFRPSFVLVALALVVHFGALLGQLAWLQVSAWRVSRDLIAQAASAGSSVAASPSAAFAAVARRYDAALRRAGKPTSSDALPLLARAAPSIASLPPGSLKSMHYANDAWTLELANVGPDRISGVTQALDRAGVAAISAAAAGGTRMRLTLDPSAR
ncbi:MAG TPA: type II secretion system protein GspL [Casimicrobiaceae bacterium]|nr:type II secretion system protein GspL [Casimicrobiaceae bacterium]